MKLGVFTVVLGDMDLPEAAAYLGAMGVNCVELGAGGFPGKRHLDPEAVAHDPVKAKEVLDILGKNKLTISALSCHGNPVHPNKELAARYHAEFETACLAAEALGVDTLVGFSGCPGDSPSSRYPNWVTCSWPEDFPAILEYQWDEVLIPYWKKAAAFAAGHGIKKIAFEMHPGFCVYNTSTCLRLREAVGDIIGANFDPSHLFWQGIDPCAAIRELGGAVYHFHAKDTKIDRRNTEVNGVLDTGHYAGVSQRSWVFRTVGYGHGLSVWNNIISALQTVGYHGAISIEHEDSLMSPKEGLEKAIANLKQVLIYEEPGQMYWA